MEILWSKKISVLTGWLVGCLALFSFVLSYEALWTLALDSDITPWLAWLFPLTIDFFVVVASLSILRHSINLEPKRLSWALVIAFSILSTIFNAVHNGLPLDIYATYIQPWLRIVVYIVPPVSLVFSFHLLMVQIENSLKQEIESRPIPQDKFDNSETLHQSWPETSGESVQVLNTPVEVKAGKVEDRRRQIPEMYQAGLSEGQMADKLGVSIKTIQRDMAALNLNGVNK